jgi:hypothetical protein
MHVDELEDLYAMKVNLPKDEFYAICKLDDCAKLFSSPLKRQKFCSTKCANLYHVRLFLKREKFRSTPALRREKKREKNVEWQNFHIREQFGEDAVPPKLRGRPTLRQKAAIEEWKWKEFRRRHRKANQ